MSVPVPDVNFFADSEKDSIRLVHCITAVNKSVSIITKSFADSNEDWEVQRSCKLQIADGLILESVRSDLSRWPLKLKKKFKNNSRTKYWFSRTKIENS